MRLPVNPLDAFDVVQTRCTALQDEIWQVKKQASADYAQAIAIEARARGCKSKDPAKQFEVIGEDDRQLFEMLYRQDAEAEVEQLESKLKKLYEMLGRVRASIRVESGSQVVTWEHINQHGSSRLSSNYQEAEADLMMFAAQRHYPELKWEMQSIRRTRSYVDSGTPSVVVRLRDERMRNGFAPKREVLGAVSVKEQARFYLKRACNLRCINPFLPYGIEAKLGMDYWGNDIPEKASHEHS